MANKKYYLERSRPILVQRERFDNLKLLTGMEEICKGLLLLKERIPRYTHKKLPQKYRYLE